MGGDTVTVTLRCDTCSKRTKPLELTSMDDQISGLMPDSWGVYRQTHGKIYLVCPKCWGWWKK